jgi:hypothetical protein
MITKTKGYRVERKVRLEFEKRGWTVVRAGASLGEADLICLKGGKCLLLQVKSTKKKAFYYYGFNRPKLEGFPFYLVVDFGYRCIRILKPKPKVLKNDGVSLFDFLEKNK